MAQDDAAGKGSTPELDGLSAMAYEIAKRRQAAAVDVVAMLEEKFETWFESNAATLLHACAWLAGTSLFRSFGFDHKAEPGTPVLSDRANLEGVKLLKVFMFLIEKDGIDLKSDDLAAELPPADKPVKTILEVQEQFQQRYNQIMRDHSFDYAEGARTGAVACARLVKIHCLNRKDLEPRAAVSIVSMGFVEGSKTAPAKL
jgi:hypothetical protein